jgi:hypothetical protein
MFATSLPTELNFEIAQGKCMASMIDGKLKIYSDEQSIRDDMRHALEIYNTRIAEQPTGRDKSKDN